MFYLKVCMYFLHVYYLYLYHKYWKNAETAVELPGLSSWSIFLYSYSLIIILIICKGGRGTRGCILTGQCTMYNVPGAKKLKKSVRVMRDMTLFLPATIKPGFEGVYGGSLNYYFRQRVPVVNHSVTKCVLPYICPTPRLWKLETMPSCWCVC